MKKLIAFIIFTVVFTSACEDAIDIEQVGRLGAEQAFESVADLESGLLGVYNRYDYTSMIQFNAVFTDQISIGVENGGQGLTNGEFGFRLNPQSAFPTTLWVGAYGALNAATRLIEAAELVVPEDDEVTTYENILGEAYALRAWAHFELLTYFSPDLTDDSAPGVIILNFVPGTEQQLPRNSTGEVFGAIESDLAATDTLITTESSTTFISEDFVKALRARMNAYRGRYTQADALAAELLEDYPLANPEEYVAMFLDEDNTEIIFKLERTIGDSYDGQGATGSGSAGGWAGANFSFTTVDAEPYFEMSQSLFEELNPEDVRYDVLIHESSDLSDDPAQSVIKIGKYPGSEGQPLMNDLKVFRAAEMLLIRAEAAAANNQLSAVAGFLDQLQDARFGEDLPAPEIGTQQTAFRLILEARRIELAYEGFRWVDIKRLGERAGVPGIVRNAADCEINGQCELNLSDVRLQAVPIPLAELDANNTIQQTPGY